MSRKIGIVFGLVVIVLTLNACGTWQEKNDIEDTEQNTEHSISTYVEEVSEEATLDVEIETETEIETEIEIEETTEELLEAEIVVENQTPIVDNTIIEEVIIQPDINTQPIESISPPNSEESLEMESGNTETEEPAPNIPTTPIVTEWNLILVNKWNKIPDGYSVELVDLPNGEKVDARICSALIEMFTAAMQENIFLIVRDGYRTPEEQQLLLNETIQTYIEQGYSQVDAEAEASKWVAAPGASEHQLGIAVDINADESKSDNPMIGNDIAYMWLEANAYKYGLILRYPATKTNITGINHEPWHYRYVGVEAAKEIYERRICLEEYLVY